MKGSGRGLDAAFEVGSIAFDALPIRPGSEDEMDTDPQLPPPPPIVPQSLNVPAAPARSQTPTTALAPVTARPRRSVGIAVLLTILFGPFGLYYTETPLIATLAVAGVIVLAIVTAGLSGFVTYPATVVVAAVRASSTVT
jgi:hypothetical protein